MRVVAPEIEIADAPAAWNRPLNIELVGLAIATIVALSGIGLAYSAKLARLDEAVSPGGVISLRALHSPVELEPALTMYDSAYERSAVARALFNRATAAPRLDHVGALADVKMSAAAVHADRRLVQLNA